MSEHEHLHDHPHEHPAGPKRAWHLRGVILDGDGAGQAGPRDLWVADGQVAEGPVAGAEHLAEDVWVLPGLVDAHCHIGVQAAPGGGAQPASPALQETQAITDRDGGTLLIRDAGSPANTTWIDQRDDLPHLIRAGRHIARTRRYIKGLGVEVEPEELVAEVTRQARHSQGWIKLVGDWIDRSVGDLAPCWPAEVAAQAIAQAHELGCRVTAHCFGEQAVAEMVAAGIDCIEHGTGLTPPVITEMAARGTALVPTCINLENFPHYADQGEARFPAYAAHMRHLYATHKDVLGAARDAGVAIYCGTDAGTVIPHGQAGQEVVRLGEIGGADFALGAATWRARPWLGRPSLEVGAPADFVVYRADPRQDLQVVTHPWYVMLGGRLVYQS